jgi:Sec-independent protein translocase protein TatA
MYLLDVAVGPMYAMIGGTFLLLILVAAGIVFGAVKLIEFAVRKNKNKEK